MNILEQLSLSITNALLNLYNYKTNSASVSIQKTRVEFEGDFTVVVFPFLRFSKKTPEETASQIGDKLLEEDFIENYNVVKGFLNISIKPAIWISFLAKANNIKKFGYAEFDEEKSKKIMIEFSSPNTNKPLHLGHIRNNLLGHSIAKILEANGHKVTKVNLVNDRGIHICKSMLAWQKWGNNITPEKANLKGDKLVGDYYVLFDREYKKQVQALIENGYDNEKAKTEAPLLKEAQEMLRKWEAGDKEIRELWKKMNDWVYKGFDITYNKLGIEFDKIYYESDTYKKGKAVVLKGLGDTILIKKRDKSVWADLTDEGLDEKILLRSDGTSVYMTQDIGTAIERYDEFKFDKHLYVVGNEQNYHFQVLKIVLKKLGYNWFDKLEHISYGMVELPDGKMKSREGTVVDADELIEHMQKVVETVSYELGKLDGLNKIETEKIITKIALGALKYFILKVDPKKNMLFNPEESIDLNGNTGPFIQYTYARIQSILRKVKELQESSDKIIIDSIKPEKKERDIIRLIYDFQGIIKEAGDRYSPALIANYIYELVKLYNQFYHDFPILKENNLEIRNFRILLSSVTSKTIETALNLLGIQAPERM